MKKVYFLFLLSCMSFVALSQTTVTIYATGATGSFITGNSTDAARADVDDRQYLCAGHT